MFEQVTGPRLCVSERFENTESFAALDAKAATSFVYSDKCE